VRRLPRSWRFRHYRWQWGLAVAALATAVSLPVILLSVGDGVVAAEIGSLQNAGYQIVIATAGDHGISDAHALTSQIRHLPRVAAVSPILSSAVDLFSGGSLCSPALAEGVIPSQFQPTEGSTESGLFPSPLPLGDPTDLVHFANGSYTGPETYDVLVSSPLAQTCSISKGERVVLSSSSNTTNGVGFNVTGTFGVPPSTLGPAAAFAIVLPLSDLQQLLGFGRDAGTGALIDAVDTVQVALSGSASTNATQIGIVADQIRSIVPYYSVTTLTQQADQLRSGTAVLDGFYLALSSVSLTVGLIFLTLVMLRRVESQRRSIGIRRAIGVPGRQVAGEMTAHALTLAAAGSLLGVAGGYLVVRILAVIGSPTVQLAANLAVFDPVTLIEVVLAVLGLSLLAAAAATRAALRLPLAEALR
jgi:ABC-type lipoprotein release transport system permease subunit